MLDGAGNSPLKIGKLANIEGDMSEKREDKASIKREIKA